MRADPLVTAGVLVRERWLPGPARRHATAPARLRRFLERDLPAFPRYRPYAGAPLADIPVVDKATVLSDFTAFNRHGIPLHRALAVARAAERTRDFSATLDGLTVGLSSGTSGQPGVFLVSPAERRHWAGLLMAELLAPASLRLLARRPLQVCLVLRSGGGLYESLGTGRVRFHYRDLTAPLPDRLDRPVGRSCTERAGFAGVDVLVAPPSVLRELAQRPGAAALRLTQVVAVAETVEPDDRDLVRQAFGVRLEQVYQATEGLLGVSCPLDRIHLGDRHVLVEPQWLDAEHFVPVVTDFSRTTQAVVRHRLDDVLHADRPLDAHCACGRPGRSVASVLGREGDVLRLRGPGGLHVPVFADALRHAVALAPGVDDYRLEQHGEVWHLALRGPARPGAVHDEVSRLARRLGATPPAWATLPWPDEPATTKRRRIRGPGQPASAAATAAAPRAAS